MSPVVRVSTYIDGVSKGDGWENIHFCVNLGMWPLKLIIPYNWVPVERVSTHIYGVSGRNMEKFLFLSKPRQMTPQIYHLGKTSPVLGFQHTLWGFQEKYGKFYFWVNLGMWPLKLIIPYNWVPLLGFQHTFMVFPGEIWKNFIFE